MAKTILSAAFTLGLISAAGGLAMDMYLPAFSDIAGDLGSTIGAVQLSLVAYLLALACGQLVYGPLSDIYGRKAPLVAGMALYTATSIGCACVQTADQLILLRFLQGLGGCAGVVIVRAVVRDTHRGAEAVRLLALIMMVMGISPVLSPILGAGLTQVVSWRSIFWCLAGAGVASTLLATFVLRESHPLGRRQPPDALVVFRSVLHLLMLPRFLGLSIIPALVQGSSFAFVAASSFLFTGMFELSPGAYSIVFAAGATTMIGGAQFTAPAVRRFGPHKVILGAVFLHLVGGLLLVSATLFDRLSVVVVVATFLICFSSIGFINPPATMLALEDCEKDAGAASALMGSTQMGLSAIGGTMVSVFFDGTARPVALTMVGLEVAALAVALFALGPTIVQQLGRGGRADARP